MCRNIKTLFNFEPPATELEIRDASLQFVRKLSGFSVPSQVNAEAFDKAVLEIAASARSGDHSGFLVVKSDSKLSALSVLVGPSFLPLLGTVRSA